ncbi:MAG TPA: hypothetical protein VLF60_01995 [Candidatus Saccharimonadales bacterium]|nr:hypothetical protein [Candidatus Saccharimonadales bacterium]
MKTKKKKLIHKTHHILGILLIIGASIAGAMTGMQHSHAASNTSVKEDIPGCTEGVSGFGITFSVGEIRYYENDPSVQFKVLPYGMAGIRSVTAIPDAQTDVGNGLGVPRVIRIDYADGSWFIDSHYWPSAPFIGSIGSNAHLNITFSAQCYDSSSNLHTIPLTTVITQDGLPESAPDDTPPAEDAPNTSDTPAPTPQPKSSGPSSKPSASAPPQDVPSTPQLLNDMDGYKTKGAVAWLKPKEQTLFNVSYNGKTEQHSITVHTVGTDAADITIASDPINVTLHLNEIKAFDVNGDGKNDIQVQLVGFADGQAGILVKPLTEEAKTTAKTTAQLKAQAASVTHHRSYKPWIVAVTVFLVGLVIALGIAVRTGKLRLPFKRPRPTKKKR